MGSRDCCLCLARSFEELANFTFATIREEAAVMKVPQFLAEAFAMPRDFINKRIPPLMFNYMASGDYAKVRSF